MTRHVRSWALAALAAFALAGAATPSLAGITYNVTNYAAGQNGWSLAGTITVSGAGTFTNANAITAWDLTTSKDLVSHRYSNTTSTANTPIYFAGTLGATSTTLSLPAGSSLVFFEEATNTARIQWENAFVSMGTNTSYSAGWTGVGTLWYSGNFSPIVGSAFTLGTATPSAVPEIDPAMGGSALSLVAGVLAMIEQRRRRAMLVA
jgi:hypothetical protein